VSTVAPPTTRTPEPVRARPRRRRGRALRSRTAPHLFILPAVVLYVCFTLIPVGYALVTSFFAQRLTGGSVIGVKRTVYVGLENYHDVLTEGQLLSGVGRVLLYGVIAVPLTLGLALLFALLLDAPATRARGFGRTAVFVPYAVPGVVGALMWGFLYLPATSPFSYLTRGLGLGSLPFLDARGLYGAFANISIWGGVGFNMLVIFTALRSIPRELVEAARLDGAGEVQIALRIKVPLVTPALALTAIFGVLGALQLYGEPLTLKPLSTAIFDTWAPLLTIYRDAFVVDNLSGAAAASVVLALGTSAVTLVVLGLSRYLTRRNA
jgi:multiple sugar transport system permease protein